MALEELERAHGLAAGRLSFEIQVEVPHLVLGPDGTVERLDGIKPDTKELFSSTDISIKNLVPGKYIIKGWPDGTSADAYTEGRVLELTIKP